MQMLQFQVQQKDLVPSFQQGEFQSTGGENIVLIGVSSVILYTAGFVRPTAGFVRYRWLLGYFPSWTTGIEAALPFRRIAV